jgi:DNA modification methylase
VVTSPPYWGLRDYNVAGQIGLEKSIDEYVQEMVNVFREVRRVLRSDGTLWLNLGDSYTSGGRTTQINDSLNGKGPVPKDYRSPLPIGLKPKDLCGIPWRVAFALQADGWYLRQDIIWNKPNPMPESVADRCTKSHEYIFLLTKNANYFYDSEAIKEKGTGRSSGNSGNRITDGNPLFRYREGFAAVSDKEWNSRNKRSVWTVTTQPYSKAHFATFPPALIKDCIKAGTSEKGCCSKCGSSWERVMDEGVRKRIPRYPQDSKLRDTKMHGPPSWKTYETKGWQATCKCEAEVVPCTVLDPFGGAGTTALTANRFRRNAISIELNSEYIKMGQRRLPRLFGDNTIEYNQKDIP